jgi:hypothetical protein
MILYNYKSSKNIYIDHYGRMTSDSMQSFYDFIKSTNRDLSRLSDENGRPFYRASTLSEIEWLVDHGARFVAPRIIDKILRFMPYPQTFNK